MIPVGASHTDATPVLSPHTGEFGPVDRPDTPEASLFRHGGFPDSAPA